MLELPVFGVTYFHKSHLLHKAPISALFRDLCCYVGSVEVFVSQEQELSSKYTLPLGQSLWLLGAEAHVLWQNPYRNPIGQNLLDLWGSQKVGKAGAGQGWKG